MSIIIDDPPEAPPPTCARTRRAWWRFIFPWVKTAVAAPDGDDELLIDNETSVAWSIHLGYHFLGVVAPFSQRHARASKAGLLTARQLDAPTGAGYLTVYIGPHVRAVEIHALAVLGSVLYDLRLVEGAAAIQDARDAPPVAGTARRWLRQRGRARPRLPARKA